MGKIKVRSGFVVLMLILVIVGVANAAPKIVSEKFYVDSP